MNGMVLAEWTTVRQWTVLVQWSVLVQWTVPGHWAVPVQCRAAHPSGAAGAREPVAGPAQQ